MSTKTRDNNVTNLKKQYKKLTGVKQFKVNSLIDLYGRGNIYNINTLRNEINKILTPSDNQQQQIDTYFDIITKLKWFHVNGVNTFNFSINFSYIHHR
jgi:hypothetical protein